jgi:hypothetical protein
MKYRITRVHTQPTKADAFPEALKNGLEAKNFIQDENTVDFTYQTFVKINRSI